MARHVVSRLRDRPRDPYDASPELLAAYGITPEMIEAGAELVRSQFGEITTYESWLAPDLAVWVFRAMTDRRAPGLPSQAAPEQIP